MCDKLTRRRTPSMGYDARLYRAQPIAESEFERLHEAYDADLRWAPSDGDILVVGPTRDDLRSAVRIAERLGAQVFGDDGERYWLDDGELRDDRRSPAAAVGGLQALMARPMFRWWMVGLLVLAILTVMFWSGPSVANAGLGL